MKKFLALALAAMMLMACHNKESEPQRQEEKPGQTNPAEYLRNDDQMQSLRTLRDVYQGRLYAMEYRSGYYLNQLLDEGCSNVVSLLGFIFENLLDLHLTAEPSFGCSAFQAVTPEGDIIVGRNFDYIFKDAVNLRVHNVPTDGGYKSVSTVTMSFLGPFDYAPGCFTDGKTDISSLMASIYIPMDGMNEHGLTISVLQLDGEGSRQYDKTKKDIFTTVVLRYILDRAKTVDEALAMLQNYNMFTSFTGTQSFHFFLADPSGKSVVLEYITNSEGDWVMSPVDINYCANSYMSPGWEDKGHGFDRLNKMKETLAACHNVMTEAEAMQLLKDVHQKYNPDETTSNTMWSVVYNLTRRTATICVNKDFDHPLTYTVTM